MGLREENKKETFDFDAEFAKGLILEEFKNELSKRIKAYPWKNRTQE